MATYQFRRVYADRWLLFRDGRCVCDYRRTGRAWRVRQFFPNSDVVYRATLVSSEDVARAVALELAETPEAGDE